MKKLGLALSVLPLIICGCSCNQKEEKKPLTKVEIPSTKKEEVKEDVEIITIIEKGEEIDIYDGYWEEIYNGSKVIVVNDDYEFNYTALKFDGDVDITTFAKLSGKLTYDNYVVILDKINLSYFYSGKWNMTSLFLRGDKNKLKYELRSNRKATLEITNVWQFVKIEDEIIVSN